MLSEWVRRSGYWSIDFLKGSKVKKHYMDIKRIMDNNQHGGISKVQDEYLSNILTYATKNVEFYKPYTSHSSLKAFPIINKSVIKDHYDEFQSSEYVGKNVINLHTSGSTGTPFVVRQDVNKRNRVLAEMMYFWGKAGYQIGMRYAFFRIWTSVNRKSLLTAWSRNVIMCDILRLDNENLEKIRNMLKSDHKIKMLIGYASTFENLANYLYHCGDKPDMFNVKVIISSSEVLPEITRERLEKVFGCTVVSLYSNQENGMIAQECVENSEFHVNSASFHIELLKLDSDEHVGVGEEGRIVVTDLFNHAMPLIRYDTGDIGVWKEKGECGWGTQTLHTIKGRKIDYIYNTKGQQLSPHTVTNYMWPFDKVLQFQFIQEGEKEYVLKLNGAKAFYDDTEFVELYKGILGNDAKIIIEHVSEIPVLKSGKRKKVVCNYTPAV